MPQKIAVIAAPFICLLTIAAPTAGQSFKGTAPSKLEKLLGEWTLIYHKPDSVGLRDDRIDKAVFPSTVKITKDKLHWLGYGDAPRYSAVFDFEPDGEPWLLEMLELDDQRRLAKVEVLYYLRDDFLMMARQPPPIRPLRFSINPKIRQAVSIYRRGKLEAPDVSHSFTGDRPPREAENIEGTWTKVYYEGQGFFFSLVMMEDLTKVHRVVTRKVPFMEHIPLEWKVTKDLVEEGGERDGATPYRYAYTLDPSKGFLDMIPLDSKGNKLERAKREAVYFVKDDFMFVRFQIEPQRWQFGRSGTFTSELDSKTALLIFRRGPLKLAKSPLQVPTRG